MIHFQRFMKNLKIISSASWNKCNTSSRQIKFRANNDSIILTSDPAVYYGAAFQKEEKRD